MDTYVYEYGSGLYVNLTNRCNNNCAFCLRHTNQGVGSHRLWLEHEPTAEQVIEKMQDLSAYEEVVFCGFGEPTLAWETLKQIAAYVKQQGKPVRVNTNGLGNLANGRDITPEAEGLVDTFSISLNAATPEAYQELCHSQYGLQALSALLEFAKLASRCVPHVVFTVVDSIGPEEIEKSRELAQRCGAKLRVRAYVENWEESAD